MINSLQGILAAQPPTTSMIDLLLPQITRDLQDEFTCWVDGGAGVGTSATVYAATLEQNLDPAHVKHALVACYEPLPENVAVLQQRLGDNPRYKIRDVAVSSAAGEARFTVPSRITSAGAGPWAPGTSFAGSLRHGAPTTENITVRTVRLEDEDLPRLDFVKLDLQGAELDAMQGMGKRLHETKLLHVETQLLHDWGALRFLAGQGFALFYDRLQFGFRDNLTYMPLTLMQRCGIVIDRMHLPQASGMPLICWGHFEPATHVIDPHSLVMRTEIAKELIAAGFSYLQTDTLAVNLKWLPRIAPALMPQ